MDEADQEEEKDEQKEESVSVAVTTGGQDVKGAEDDSENDRERLLPAVSTFLGEGEGGSVKPRISCPFKEQHQITYDTAGSGGVEREGKVEVVSKTLADEDSTESRTVGCQVSAFSVVGVDLHSHLQATKSLSSGEEGGEGGAMERRLKTRPGLLDLSIEQMGAILNGTSQGEPEWGWADANTKGPRSWVSKACPDINGGCVGEVASWLGRRVRLKGLQSQPHYNDCVGTVKKVLAGEKKPRMWVVLDQVCVSLRVCVINFACVIVCVLCARVVIKRNVSRGQASRMCAGLASCGFS